MLIPTTAEIRVDAWKLCQLMRRAEPRSAEDTGTWHAILEVTSIFAIFINSGLVAFTATNLENMTWPLRVWTFILMSAGIFALRGFIAFAIPDIPEWVDIQVNYYLTTTMICVMQFVPYIWHYYFFVLFLTSRHLLTNKLTYVRTYFLFETELCCCATDTNRLSVKSISLAR